jgi:hypothetical protein
MATARAETPAAPVIPIMSTEDEWDALEGDFGNYGDVALQLTSAWRRGNSTPPIEEFYVGHVNGKSDVCRAKEPRTRFQFRWVDLKNESSLNMIRRQGYKLVLRHEGWVKNPGLWIWDKIPQGEVINMLGLPLMYRPAELWEAEQHKQTTRERDAELESLNELAKHARRLGVVVQDRDGNILEPVARPHA